MGFFENLFTGLFIFNYTSSIHIYVIKYSNNKEVFKVKNKLFPSLPILFPSLEVITVIILVYVFPEFSLWVYIHF